MNGNIGYAKESPKDRRGEHPKERSMFLEGVKACLPTLFGYFSIGFAAGIVEKTAGLSLLEIALLCLLLYAGSAQFILAGMVQTAFSAIAVAVTIFFVNLRHLLFSAALAPYFRRTRPAANFAVGALLTDESFGVASDFAARNGYINEKWMHGLNVTAYLGWFAANMAGAAVGQYIESPTAWGMDFALPAMFIGLLVMQMQSRGELAADVAVAIVAAVSAVFFSLAFSSSVGVILATVTAATFGLGVERWKSARKS
mgnify:CR=1 FL=1